jgi:hypothetical protein
VHGHLLRRPRCCAGERGIRRQENERGKPQRRVQVPGCHASLVHDWLFATDQLECKHCSAIDGAVQTMVSGICD